MSKTRSVSLVLIAVAALAGCGSTDEGSGAAGGTRDVRRATAWLNPTSGSSVAGSAIFIREGEAITLQVSIQGAEPGMHACHIHEVGDCSAEDGSSAGGHWNPAGVEHGKWGQEPYHLGDLGNIEVGADGKGTLMLTSDRWSMGDGGDGDIMGRAVIIHSGADDFTTQPTGGAGGRLACGVIRAG